MELWPESLPESSPRFLTTWPLLLLLLLLLLTTTWLLLLLLLLLRIPFFTIAVGWPVMILLPEVEEEAVEEEHEVGESAKYSINIQ